METEKGEVKGVSFSLFVGTKAGRVLLPAELCRNDRSTRISMTRFLVLIQRELFGVCHYEMKILFGQ